MVRDIPPSMRWPFCRPRGRQMKVLRLLGSVLYFRPVFPSCIGFMQNKLVRKVHIYFFDRLS